MTKREKSNLEFDAEFIEATRDAEFGVCKCRICGDKGLFSRFIAITYGGGLVYAMCMGCAESNEILIKRGAFGVEVLGRSTGNVVAAGRLDLGVIKKKVK
jgi:hypothetical protein